MAIDLDEIRKVVAMRHDVLIGDDDPLLIEATMFENLLEQSIKGMNAQQAQNLRTLVNAVQQGTADTRSLAGKVVADGKESVCTAIKETMDEGREEIRKDLRLAWNKINEAKKAAIFAAALSTLCTVVIGAAMLNVL